jgi:hypothetical protein
MATIGLLGHSAGCLAGRMSLAKQKQVFAELHQQHGTAPWASGGC